MIIESEPMLNAMKAALVAQYEFKMKFITQFPQVAKGIDPDNLLPGMIKQAEKELEEIQKAKES